MVRELRSRARLYGLKSLADAGKLVDSAREHIELLDALINGDRRAAEHVMSHHIQHVRGIWANKPE